MPATSTPEPVTADARRVVRVYMGDHLTVMRAGRGLAGRMLRGGAHGRSEDEVRAAAGVLDDGCATLAALLRQLGASPPRTKLLAGAAAEIAGRAKLNGRVRGRSPLSEVLELEALTAALALTAAGWRGLRAAGIAADPVVADPAARCEQVRERVAASATRAAARVLSQPTGPVPR
jgi:hypothetical protein